MKPLVRQTGILGHRTPTTGTRNFGWAFTWLPLIGMVAFLASAPFWLVRLMDWLIRG